MSKGWIAVDLDGTLAHYDGWVSELHIGAPIWPMVQRIRNWLAQGVEVRIFTARVYPGGGRDVGPIKQAIADYTLRHIGTALEATCQKDYAMIELWDDRAVQVVPNTGMSLADAHEAEMSALRGKVAKPFDDSVPEMILQPLVLTPPLTTIRNPAPDAAQGPGGFAPIVYSVNGEELTDGQAKHIIQTFEPGLKK